MGSHPTNCHRIWEAFRCTWALKTDWISACIRVDYVCVHRTNFALSLVPCCTGQCRTQMWHILQKTSCKFYKTGHCCTSSVYKGCTMLCSAALQHIGLSGICIAFQPCTPYTICVVFNSFTAHHCVVHILTRVPIHSHSGTEKRLGGAICR